MQDVANRSCWGLIVAIWIVAAFRLRNPSLRQPLGSGATWRFAAAAGLIYAFAHHDLHRIMTRSGWVEIPGLAILVASTIFTVWARFSLGSMWSMSPNALKDQHQLRTDGPYGITRHPIYTGLIGPL